MSVLDLDLHTLKLVVEQMPKPKTFLYDTFFSNRENLPTQTVTIEYKSGHRLVAPMVNRFEKGQEMPKDTFSGRSYRPFKIAPKKTFTADEFAFERTAGENPFSPKDPETRKAEKVSDTMLEQTEQIARRMEKMAADVLYSLTFKSEGENVKDEITYYDSSPTEHITNVSNTWDNANADPIQDLKDIRREIVERGGVTPDAVILDPLASDLFQKNETVQKMLNLRNAYFGEMRPEIEGVNGVAYIGTIPGLGLDLYEYQEYFETYDPKTKKYKTEKIIPDYTVLFAPKGNLVKFGAESTIANGLMTGALIPRVHESIENDTVEIRTISKPVLIPLNTKSLRILKVK